MGLKLEPQQIWVKTTHGKETEMPRRTYMKVVWSSERIVEIRTVVKMWCGRIIKV